MEKTTEEKLKVLGDKLKKLRKERDVLAVKFSGVGDEILKTFKEIEEILITNQRKKKS